MMKIKGASLYIVYFTCKSNLNTHLVINKTKNSTVNVR